MRRFKVVLCLAVAAALGVSFVAASAQEHREKIDASEAKTIKALVEAHPEAKAELESSYGYAVMEISVAWGDANFADKQGEGVGVAVARSSGKRTYMECIANPDREITESHIIFLFEDEAAFKSFIGGWKAGTSEKKTQAKAGLTLDSGFVGGVKVYEMRGGELVSEARIWNSSYHPSKHLNAK